MTDTFTASNGVTLSTDARGRICYTGPEGSLVTVPIPVGKYVDGWNGFTADSPVAQALREFFRDEEDKRLGRWRDPARPGYVVYTKGANRCRVVRETNAGYFDAQRGFVTDSSHFGSAARAYFDAHPVEPPKPWHDAKPGEVWELETPATGKRAYQVVRNAEAGFRFFLITNDPGFRPGLFPEEAQITAGRRIWPEES